MLVLESSLRGIVYKEWREFNQVCSESSFMNVDRSICLVWWILLLPVEWLLLCLGYFVSIASCWLCRSLL